MRTIPFNPTAVRLADLTRLPTDLACSQLRQQAELQHCLFDVLKWPGAQAADRAAHALRDSLATLLGLPFDVARAQHAAGVLTGALPRSLLESTQFERQLAAMERLVLGPMARRV
ncbi:MAG: hypothetical protein ACRC2B_03915 [Rubrivivax sp.]